MARWQRLSLMFWMVKNWEDNGKFNKVYLYRFLSSKLPNSRSKLIKGREPSHERFITCLREEAWARREGQDELPNSAFFLNSSSPRFSICPDAIIQVCPGPINLLNTNFHTIKSLWVEFTMCSDQELCQHWPSYFCNLPMYRKRS